ASNEYAANGKLVNLVHGVTRNIRASGRSDGDLIEAVPQGASICFYLQIACISMAGANPLSARSPAGRIALMRSLRAVPEGVRNNETGTERGSGSAGSEVPLLPPARCAGIPEGEGAALRVRQ